MKIGNKIKCINSNQSESLNRGSTYEVVDINQYNNIQVKPLNGEPLQHYYKPEERFELVEATEPAMKIDLSKTYKTRDGKEVRLFAISDDKYYPVVGQAKDGDTWNNETWTIEGRFYEGDDFCRPNDLVEVVTEIIVKFPEHNITAKINQDLSVNFTNNLGTAAAFCAPKVMAALVDAYNRMKQCNG